MNVIEKVAYVRGLAEGLELDENKKEVKLLNAIIDLLDDMALEVSDLEDGYNDMEDQIDLIDEDLNSLEEDFYDEDCDCGCDCDCDEDDELFCEVVCPTCNEKICISEDLLFRGSMECPNCGETLEFELDEDSCDCGCGCGSDCDCDDEEDCGCHSCGDHR